MERGDCPVAGVLIGAGLSRTSPAFKSLEIGTQQTSWPNTSEDLEELKELSTSRFQHS